MGNYIKNNKEEVTKGGKLLLNMIKKYNLDIVNRLECCEGLWTRKEGKFKSVIDYILVSKNELDHIEKMVIDEDRDITPYYINTEENDARIYTDHFMISATFNLNLSCLKKPRHCFALQTDKFQEMLKEQKVSDIIDESSIQESYTKWDNKVLKIRDMCHKK